jgi:hypothetical protein
MSTTYLVVRSDFTRVSLLSRISMRKMTLSLWTSSFTAASCPFCAVHDSGTLVRMVFGVRDFDVVFKQQLCHFFVAVRCCMRQRRLPNYIRGIRSPPSFASSSFTIASLLLFLSSSIPSLSASARTTQQGALRRLLWYVFRVTKGAVSIRSHSRLAGGGDLGFILKKSRDRMLILCRSRTDVISTILCRVLIEWI